MSLETLDAILYYKQISQSGLAAKAKITRQAVSKWFTTKKFNPSLNTLSKIASGLEIKPNLITHSIFQGQSAEQKKDLNTLLLWDHLYDSLSHYVAALARGELKAIARYIQVFGILKAEKIFGSMVFKKFDRLSPFIHPARRNELKKLCDTFQELNLI